MGRLLRPAQAATAERRMRRRACEVTTAHYLVTQETGRKVGQLLAEQREALTSLLLLEPKSLAMPLAMASLLLSDSSCSDDDEDEGGEEEAEGSPPLLRPGTWQALRMRSSFCMIASCNHRTTSGPRHSHSERVGE